MSVRDRNRARNLAAALPVLLIALVLGGCGGDDFADADPGSAASAPDFAPALAKAPPELAALYEQGGNLVPGGIEGFSQQLSEVEGFPVVVNNWASWCGPCRTEWPWFQDAAAAHLDRVAFIGVDGADEDEAAQTFLDTHPVPYPSFADPDEDLADETGANLIGAFPNTLFFDPDGKLVYAHQGVYPDQAALEADIEKYALSG